RVPGVLSQLTSPRRFSRRRRRLPKAKLLFVRVQNKNRKAPPGRRRRLEPIALHDSLLWKLLSCSLSLLVGGMATPESSTTRTTATTKTTRAATTTATTTATTKANARPPSTMDAPAWRPLLVPPLNFAMVMPGVYRSGYPNARNHSFLTSI